MRRVEEGLHTVKVGSRVWIDVGGRNRDKVETHLYTITHIDKAGRLFICMPNAKELLSNWRYGFKPETGKAKHYEFYTMRYATPEEIAAEEQKEREEQAQKEIAERERATKWHKEHAAEAMYEALEAAAQQLEQCMIQNSGQIWHNANTVLANTQAALKLARGEQP